MGDGELLKATSCTAEDIETLEQPAQRRPEGCGHAWRWVDGERRCKGCDTESSENARLLAALEKRDLALDEIGCQSTTDEMDSDEREGADFEGGYDAIIKIARAALPETEPASEDAL